MKPAAPTIGVVIPVRNGAATLAAAIESVVRQDPAPSDILVVDGGSEDGSADVARSFPGVRVVDQTGRGLAGARNQGICEAQGEVIGFCDSDDCWTQGSLKARLEGLLSDSQCSAVIGHVEWVSHERIPATSAQATRLGQTREGYTPGALLAHRTVFEALGAFDVGMSIGCDSDWFVRLYQAGFKLRIVPEVVLLKGARASSLSTDVTTYRNEILKVARAFVDRQRKSE